MRYLILVVLLSGCAFESSFTSKIVPSIDFPLRDVLVEKIRDGDKLKELELLKALPKYSECPEPQPLLSPFR